METAFKTASEYYEISKQAIAIENQQCLDEALKYLNDKILAACQRGECNMKFSLEKTEDGGHAKVLYKNRLHVEALLRKNGLTVKYETLYDYTGDPYQGWTISWDEPKSKK